MRGVGWDDLGRETANLPKETKFYSDVRAALARKGIDYGVEENPDDFLGIALSPPVEFATIDLLDAQGNDTGRRIAVDLRVQRRKSGDPDFPIFLLTSSPREYSFEEADRDEIIVIEKKSPELVADRIRSELQNAGRYRNFNEVLLFARHARRSLSGEALQTTYLAELRRIIEAPGRKIIEVVPENFNASILTEIRRQIQSAGKIIVLMTADEALAKGATTRLPRPNVYVELGLVLGVRGGDRKLVLIRQESAHLPSNLGGLTPIVFETSLDEEADRIQRALERAT